MIVPLDQQSRLVPDRKADRGKHFRHALAAQPILGSSDEGSGRLFVRRLEHAPIARTRAHPLLWRQGVRQCVKVRRDPPCELAATPRQEQLHFGMVEERVLVLVEQFGDVGTQRRHPVRIAGIEVIGEVDEVLALAPAGNGRNNQLGISHDFALFLVQTGPQPVLTGALRMLVPPCQADRLGPLRQTDR